MQSVGGGHRIARTPISSAAILATGPQRAVTAKEFRHPNPFFKLHGYETTSGKVVGVLTEEGKKAFAALYRLLEAVAEGPLKEKKRLEGSEIVRLALKESLIDIRKTAMLRIVSSGLDDAVKAELATALEKRGHVEKGAGTYLIQVLDEILAHEKKTNGSGVIERTDLRRALKKTGIVRTNGQRIIDLLVRKGILEDAGAEERFIITGEGVDLLFGIERFLKLNEGQWVGRETALRSLEFFVGEQHADLAFQMLI
ncbi:MAG: hypothetical protein KAT35_02115, partial [Candidatus Aenigmarchaeota archaeon]|nr:hypothetical protein [Candidatus Aenigmarchaeota archaeon]